MASDDRNRERQQVARLVQLRPYKTIYGLDRHSGLVNTVATDTAPPAISTPKPARPTLPLVTLRCIECGKTSDTGKRWRAYVTLDRQLVVYCPLCAAREFGS